MRILELAALSVAVAAALPAAVPPRARAADPAPVTLESVFPPGVSVCAHASDADGAPSPAALPAPLPTPEVVSAESRDLVFVRWTGVEARPLSEEIPLEIAEGVVGLTVRASTPDPGWDVSVELLAPDGALLACRDCPEPPVLGQVKAGRGIVQMPSSDRPGGELVPGEYVFRVRAYPEEDGVPPPGDGVTASVVATLRTEAPGTIERRLDLNFIHLGGSPLSAEIASGSPRFAAMLDTLDAALAPAGIRLGRVTHRDLDAPEFDVLATREETARLMTTSAGLGRPRALNVYGVRTFEPPLNPVVGISAGIPGAAWNGTPDSGVAIRMEPFFTCTDCLGAYGSLLAHEIGHFLGFYHTSEADLESWDPFSDTPECREAGLGSCPDWYYVMFPVIHVANRIWSPAQAAVARTHPLVRTVPVVGRRTAPAPDRLRAAPNPFRGSVVVEAPGTGGPASVHDVSGRRVAVLGGPAPWVWDGRAEDGSAAPAGVYFVRVGADDDPRTVRVVRLR